MEVIGGLSTACNILTAHNFSTEPHLKRMEQK